MEPDELEDKGPVTEGTEADDELEDKPELPKEPVDKNADIEVQVQTRAEKKRNRFREVEERATRAEQAAEEARKEAREAREINQRQLSHPQSQQQPQRSPVQERLGQLQEAKRRLDEHYTAIASQPGYDPRGKDAQTQRDFEAKAWDIENMRVAAISQASQPAVNEQDLMKRMALQTYLNGHSDITHDPRRWEWAHARWVQRKAEGQADTIEMADEVMEEARIKFGLQPRKSRGSRPDPATRARLSGISAQAQGGGQEVGLVKMNAMERKMAREMYDKLPPEQAYQKWANGPGKRAAQKRASR